MVYPLAYRRPPYVSSVRDSMRSKQDGNCSGESLRSGSSGAPQGIPDALSFDRIISGGACPPCTLRDFMNYLKYIERAAENLQFFLWHRDYTSRFAQLPEKEKGLLPEWTVAQAEEEALAAQLATKKSSPADPAALDVTKVGTISAAEKGADPFEIPPQTLAGDRADGRSSEVSDWNTSRERRDHTAKAKAAFEEAGLTWPILQTQPYREEVTRIVSIYIAEGAPRELNITSDERVAVLRALQKTTHPSAFRDIAESTEWSLRFQGHPNFVRWSICNGNVPRTVFAKALGVAGIVCGIITGVLLILSKASRAWRVLSFIPFFIGIATLIAAWKGMCVVLHGLHHRHLRPWELFTDGDDLDIEEAKLPDPSLSTESFGSSNSYEDEPWVARYERRNLLRKIFEREIWIQEPALRQIQDTIFFQAVLGGVVISAVATGIFCAVPKGNFF